MSGERTARRDGDGECYDPELPFLQALEREVRRHARHVAGARERARSGHSHAAISPRRDSHREEDLSHAGTGRLTPMSARVARRSLTLLALLSLIGATAFGAGRIFSGGAPDPAAVRQSTFVPVASGAVGRDRWSLRVYTRGEELCRVLAVGETESSRCSSPPGASSLGATSALSATRRYLYGVGGHSIAAVAVRAGDGLRLRAPTRALPPIGAGTARLPAGERWYVIVLARPSGEPDTPVRVQGLDRAGRPVGASVVDCPETAEPRRCPR